MSSRPTLIERAYQIARSGKCLGFGDLRRALSEEGYTAREVGEGLHGPSLRNDLSLACRLAAREKVSSRA